MAKTFIFIFSLLLLFHHSPAFAAPQNKVLAKRFSWKVAQTRHFDVHYYQGAERILPSVSAYLERAYDNVTQSLDVPIPDRLPFFIYLNHNDFEQNNIVDVGEGTGGVTEAFKNRFMVFNDGTQEWLNHVIAHEFTHVVQFYVLYSGFWKSVRLLKSVLYPLWVMEGMSEFYGGEYDVIQEEMVLRDAMTSGQWIPLTLLHGFNHVKPHQVTLAYKIGNAAIQYIAKEYGKDKISDILKTMPNRFEITSNLEDNIGINLVQLDTKFQEAMKEKYTEETENLEEPEKIGTALTHSDGIYPVFNSNPAFFKDGNKIAYISDQHGYNELFIYDLAYQRSVVLDLQKRFPDQLEVIHRDGSASSVSPEDDTILFSGEKEQKDYLYFYDYKRDRLNRLSFPLDNVYSPQFSPDGKKILFIGMKEGVTDVYLARKNGKGLQRLTDTFEDENYVRFFPDGKNILFSRERKGSAGEHERDLWMMSLETLEPVQLTTQPGVETQPDVSPAGDEIIFVSDQDGIPNLYTLLLKDKIPRQLTHVIGGNFQPAYSPDGKQIIFVSYRRVEQHLYQASRDQFIPVAAAPVKSAPAEYVPQSFEEAARVTGLRGGKPYKFRASTDFFFPIIYYSSLDGLFFSSYWLASEMLGNHSIQAAVTYASKINFLNYQVFYNYKRFRPQIQLGFLGDTEENIFINQEDVRRADTQFIAVEYPLNRFNAVRMQASTTNRRIQVENADLVQTRLIGRENLGSLSYTRDITQARYLQTTAGYRVGALYSDSNPAWDSDTNFRSVFLTYNQFVPMYRESTVAFQLFSGSSFGRDKQVFRTGGSDRLRGYGEFDANAASSRFIISNLELRFPLALNTNFHVWFFFPDFLFKNIYGSVFMDNGLLWEKRDELLEYKINNVRNSVGLGLRFEAFVLQTFAIILRLDWAYRTADGNNNFYLALGPNF